MMSSVLHATHLGGESTTNGILQIPKLIPDDLILPSNAKEVWRPISNAQTLALSSPANITLLQGGRGSGKTDVTLMKFRSLVGLGYREFLRGAIIDNNYKGLDDIVSRAKRWFSRFNDGSKFYSSKGDYRYVWKDGAELLFRALSNVEDYENSLHGQELNFLSINELTKFKNSEVFDALLSTNRSSFLPEDYPLPDGTLLPPIPLIVMPTTNSSGIGRNWVKKRFIDMGARGEIVSIPVSIYDPKLGEKRTVYRTQTHIFSTYRDNPKLDAMYIAQLESMEDPIRKAQWTLGSWDVGGDGGMFDDVFDRDTHVVEPFDIPSSWYVDRSFDYGSSHPFSVLWFATSDGSDLKLRNGKVKSTIKGDLFLIYEWLGCEEKNHNKGIRLLATDIAKGIIKRELEWGIYKRVKPGNADNAIWNVDNGNCIAADMKKEVIINDKKYPGVTWIRSRKEPGSRVAGVNKIRDYLQNAKILPDRPYRENPGLFIVNTNSYFLETFPYLERCKKNPDDVDSDQNDHAFDAARYKIYGEKTGFKSGKTQGLN
jgi:hypothetical protein